MTTVIAGFVLGLAGSLHCAAMCGPLVGVIAPVFGRRMVPALWYQAGRVLSYVSIGTLAGLVGAAAGLTGLGRGLSIAAGVLMLLAALGLATRSFSRVGTWWTAQLSRVLRTVGRARVAFPRASVLGAGLANGALPCGLVYAAGLAAATSAGPLEGAAVMLAFGAGTAPMMLGLWTSAARLPAAVRQRLRALTPAALGIVGVLLVIRGVAAATGHSHAFPGHP